MDGSLIAVEGTNWFYRDRGRGEPILYVHGNTGSSTWWEETMDLPGYRCVAPDLPNFGRSGVLGPEISIDAYADALASFMGALGLRAAVAVGHSLGGAVCMSLAARHGDLLRGLVLVDSASPKGLVTPESRYPAIELMRTNRGVLAQALKAVAPTLTDEALFERLVDDAMRMAEPAWVGNARALSTFDASARLAAWNGPVMVVWGRDDIIIDEAIARETAESFHAARLEILEDVGHSVIVEDPVRFKALLIEGLRTSFAY